MRVAVFSDALPPRVDGIAVAVRHLARGLVSEGHQVLLIGPGRRGVKGTDVNGVGVEGAAVRGATEGAGFLRLPAIPTPFDGYSMAVPRRSVMDRAVQQFRPDVISAQTVGPVGLIGLSLAYRYEVPALFSWHTDFEAYGQAYSVPPRMLAAGSYLPIVLNRRQLLSASVLSSVPSLSSLSSLSSLPSPPSGTVRGIIPASLRRASLWMTAVCAPSGGAVEQIRRIGIGRPVFVMPADVSPAELGKGTMAARQAWALIPGAGVTPYLLFVGRLSREKNLNLLIEAFLHGVQAPTRLVLVGPANDARVRAMLVTRVREAPTRIVWMPPRPRAELGEIYCGAAAFVTPSVSETQCLCVSEALALGAPVIVVDPRLAQDRPPGTVRVVRPNPQSLATAMTDLVHQWSTRPVPAHGAPSAPRTESLDSLAVRFVAAARFVAALQSLTESEEQPSQFRPDLTLLWQQGNWVQQP